MNNKDSMKIVTLIVYFGAVVGMKENLSPQEQCRLNFHDGMDEKIKIFSHPTSCSKFHMCHRGGIITKTCPPGLHFSEMSKVCDFPKIAHCQLEDLQEEQDALSSETTTSSSIHYCSQLNPHAPIKGVNCPGEVATEETDLIISDPEDCRCFYKCWQGLPRRFACPDGLYFNPNLKVCDFAERAGCQSNNTI